MKLSFVAPFTVPFLALGLWLAPATLVPVAFADSALAQLYADDFDIFVDGRGRRFLVDPDTSEVVGRANPNARFTRRDKERAERELRRVMRRGRLETELGSLFGLFDRDDREFDDESRFRGNLDQMRRKQGQQRVERQPLQPLPREEEVARLPDVSEPVQSTPSLGGIRKPQYDRAKMAALQVYLDRSGFSPGVIDGKWGSNVAKAVASWREGTGRNDDLGQSSTLDALMQQTGGEAFTSYTITQKDVNGPYVASVPVDYARKAELDALSYTSVVENLAERFHMSESYLRELNAGKNFNRAGTVITVVRPGDVVKQKVHYIIADKARKQVRAYNRNGTLVSAYPATIGSAATPSPVGTHAVARIAINPEYTYNPKKNFQQGSNDKILRIPPGPNGPVGSVWIALSKPTYGIHGTPNPETIGKTNSHGCIRLTNWDARELAKLVRKGVTVEFTE